MYYLSAHFTLVFRALTPGVRRREVVGDTGERRLGMSLLEP